VSQAFLALAHDSCVPTVAYRRAMIDSLRRNLVLPSLQIIVVDVNRTAVRLRLRRAWPVSLAIGWITKRLFS
jgi:hypothetical protein